MLFCLCFLASKFMSAQSQNSAIDEEQISTELLEETYGSFREVVSESIHRQESLLEKVQVILHYICRLYQHLC